MGEENNEADVNKKVPIMRDFFISCLVLKKVDHKVNRDGAVKEFIKKVFPASKVF